MDQLSGQTALLFHLRLEEEALGHSVHVEVAGLHIGDCLLVVFGCREVGQSLPFGHFDGLGQETERLQADREHLSLQLSLLQAWLR